MVLRVQDRRWMAVALSFRESERAHTVGRRIYQRMETTHRMRAPNDARAQAGLVVLRLELGSRLARFLARFVIEDIHRCQSQF